MSSLQTKYSSLLEPQDLYAAGSSNSVNAIFSPYLDSQYSEAIGAEPLSIALIGPDAQHRSAVALALAGCQGCEVREFTSYPPGLDDLPRLLEQHHDVIIIDLDSDPEYALDLVESICANGVATVMVYSAKADPDLLVRCMRAGAREFLTVPFAQNIIAEALVRAAARRPATRTAKKTGGRLLVFMGAKGGVGVTTLACNFAVALAQEPGQNTLLIDLDLPLGDAALNLGIVSEFSTVNALQATERLDASFLSKLLVKHSSGLSVLAAPGKFPHFQPTTEAIEKLLMVARQEFDNVVVDVGSRLDMPGTALFKDATRIYLVTQAGIPELRNSNRLISQFFTAGSPKLEIVLNRYESRTWGVSEEHITKALTRSAQWKVPNDHALVRRMQINATPLALGDSSMARMIRQMARSVTGKPEAAREKKKGFSLFG
jgi:pilus assembly protein CpaE